MTDEPIYAEDVNYWQTSKASPDRWLERAKREIRQAGGTVVGEAFAREEATGRASYLLQFQIAGDRFKMIWPVMESKAGKELAARVQAATALYHEVKAACVKAKFLGARAAFLAYLMLPDGRPAFQATAFELVEALPRLLVAPEGNNV
jgi:hypothetical protein